MISYHEKTHPHERHRRSQPRCCAGMVVRTNQRRILRQPQSQAGESRHDRDDDHGDWQHSHDYGSSNDDRNDNQQRHHQLDERDLNGYDDRANNAADDNDACARLSWECRRHNRVGGPADRRDECRWERHGKIVQ